MNGRERGIENELTILQIIAVQRWVREDELSLLSRMSLAMVRRTCIRLAKAEEIYRDRKFGGYFVRLRRKGASRTAGGKSGRNVVIPDSWKHDCLAIQSLAFLLNELGQSHVETEAHFRQRNQEGKLPDGLLLPGSIWLETELSRKSGKATMGRLAGVAIERARQKQTTVISYPHPPENCEGVRHEHHVAAAIRRLCGTQEMPHIKLLRCIMHSQLDFQHARPQKFEMIDLPALAQHHHSRNGSAIVEIPGYRWKDYVGTSELWFDGEVVQTIRWKVETEDAPSCAEADGDLLEANWDEDFTQFQVRVKNAVVVAHNTGEDIYSVFR